MSAPVGKRWSVSIDCHEKEDARAYESSTCELQIYLDEQEALLVRGVLLTALATAAGFAPPDSPAPPSPDTVRA